MKFINKLIQIKWFIRYTFKEKLQNFVRNGQRRVANLVKSSLVICIIRVFFPATKRSPVIFTAGPLLGAVDIIS